MPYYMRIIEVDNNKIEIYVSIHELPIKRYRAMQKYLLQDAGIGCTMEDFDNRISNLMMFASNGKNEDVLNEANNLRYSFYSTISNADYKTFSFCCLVKSIDGIEYNDLSGEGINVVYRLVENIKCDELNKIWEEVKKKLIPNYPFTSQSISE